MRKEFKMNCYINPDFDSVPILKKLLRDNINIIPDMNNLIKNEKFIVISDSSDISEKIIQGDFFNYDDIFNYFSSYALRRYYTCYDYYYLMHAINDASSGNFDTISVGSSYSLFGIDDNTATFKSKNLSLTSQDVYYGCKIAETVININPNIKNVLVGTGYCSLFSDLSKTKNEEEIKRVSDVYYPLLGDMHNAVMIPETSSPMKSDVFDINRILNMLSRTYYDMNNGNYFNSNRTRFSLRCSISGNPTAEWKDISEEQKIISGQERANFHNKGINYIMSYKENIDTLNNFVKLCNQKDIAVYLLAFPLTPYYSSKVDEQYKKYFFEALDKLEGEFKFIDFNKYNQFDDSDFNDMDHLNDNGAIKLTNLLNNIMADEKFKSVGA